MHFCDQIYINMGIPEHRRNWALFIGGGGGAEFVDAFQDKWIRGLLRNLKGKNVTERRIEKKMQKKRF